jgi:hypothetical protein
MNVLFLDYDGVVNTIIWNENGTKADYNHPYHGKVNNFQAVQWVSEFCQKYDYKIVVTSTWRLKENYKECLIAGGLRDGIEILGCTGRHSLGRGAEIKDYLSKHPDISQYLVADDENAFEGYPDILERFVQCNHNGGFNYEEFHLACYLHKLHTEDNKDWDE